MIRLLLILIAFITLTVSSCSDRLTFYYKGYKPTVNSKLRFDGYYFKTAEPFEIPVGVDNFERWSDPFTPRFFYQEGFVAICATHKNTQQLSETMIKYNGGHPNWGAYKISGDTLTIESLVGNSGTMRAERWTEKLTIKKDTLIRFMTINRKGKGTNFIDTLYFKPFPDRPNMSTNFIKTKKKYNR